MEWIGDSSVLSACIRQAACKEALDTLCRSCIDLMICDIEMPGGKGMELIKCKKISDVQCIFIPHHVDLITVRKQFKQCAT